MGGSTTLSWWTTNATDLTIEDEDGNIVFTAGATEVASGSHVVTPAATTDYRLTATGDAGMVIHCREKITLWEAPVIDLFRADPEIIDRGEVTRLFWGTTNTTNVSIDQGIGYMPVADGGYLDVAPAQRTTYRLTATNPAWYNGDGVTASVTVTVNRTQGPSITCSPRNRDMAQVERAMLSWETTGATDLTINDGTSTVTVAPADVAMGTHWVTPQGTTIYTLTATDQNNQTSTCPITLRIWGAPVISFTATPNVIARGETSTLKWEVANATEVNISGGFRDPRTGEIRIEETREPRYEPISGSRVVSPHRTRIYNITASNPVYHPFYEGSVDSSVTVAVTSGQAPITCSVSPSDIRAGGTATLSWETAGLSNVVLTSWSRNSQPQTVGSNGSMQVSPQRNYTYHLKGEDGNGTEYHCWANVAVWGRPVVDYFTASPASIGQGQSTRLGWSSRHATGVSISPDSGGVAPGASGFRDVSPNTDTTYTLTASNPAWSGNGATSVAVPVTVSGVGDASCTLSASDSDIKPDESTTLRWTSHNADRLILNPGNIDVTNDADRSRVVRPLEGRRTYTLTASNPGWTGGDSTTASVTVTVRPEPPGSISASPNPCTIAEGSNSCTSTISWSAQGTNATLVEVSHLTRAFASSGATGSQEAPWIQEAPAHTYIFYLYDYHDRVKGAQLDSVTVTGRRVGQPTCDSFTASPARIDPGGSSTLRWSTTNADSVSISPDPGGGRPGTSGSRSASPAMTTTYELTATNEAGSDTCTAKVIVRPRIDSFTASPSTIDPGGSSTLRWQTSGAKNVSISPDPGGGTPGTSGSRSVSPDSTTEYRLTASNDDGDSVTARETVTVREGQPTCDSFTASPANICSGGSSTLRWQTTNADSVSISPDPGGGRPGTSGSRSVSPTRTTQYTLTASNDHGTDRCMATVNVWDPPEASISASRTTINEGQPFTLSWSSSNAASVRIDPGIGAVTPNVSGSRTLRPSQGRHTYTITASGPTQSPCSNATDSVTVTVRPEPPVIDSFEADPPSITRGEASTLRWRTTNASSVTLGGSGVDDDGSEVVIPYNTSRYTLTARNADAQVSEQVTVTVSLPPAPVINNLYPSQGVPDSPVTIYGTNFGTDQGSVSFSGSSAEINSWGTTEVSVLVPRQLSWGTVWVSLTAYGQTSNSVRYEVTGGPVREECDEDEEDCPERDEEEGEEEENPPPDP